VRAGVVPPCGTTAVVAVGSKSAMAVLSCELWDTVKQ
jgi:hypothetical protein